MIFGFIITGGWMLIKLIFLGISIRYLYLPRIRLLFHGNASSKPSPATEPT